MSRYVKQETSQTTVVRTQALIDRYCSKYCYHFSNRLSKLVNDTCWYLVSHGFGSARCVYLTKCVLYVIWRFMNEFNFISELENCERYALDPFNCQEDLDIRPAVDNENTEDDLIDTINDRLGNNWLPMYTKMKEIWISCKTSHSTNIRTVIAKVDDCTLHDNYWRILFTVYNYTNGGPQRAQLQLCSCMPLPITSTTLVVRYHKHYLMSVLEDECAELRDDNTIELQIMSTTD